MTRKIDSTIHPWCCEQMWLSFPFTDLTVAKLWRSQGYWKQYFWKGWGVLGVRFRASSHQRFTGQFETCNFLQNIVVCNNPKKVPVYTICSAAPCCIHQHDFDCVNSGKWKISFLVLPMEEVNSFSLFLSAELSVRKPPFCKIMRKVDCRRCNSHISAADGSWWAFTYN